MSVNDVMMQYFYWYVDPDGSLWSKIANQAEDLARIGITAFDLIYLVGRDWELENIKCDRSSFK